MNNKYYDKYKRNKESRAFYTSTAWLECRKIALERDAYLCQDCLLKSKNNTCRNGPSH